MKTVIKAIFIYFFAIYENTYKWYDYNWSWNCFL